MDVFHDCCAGLDVHKEWVYVCVLSGKGSRPRKFQFKFSTFHHQLIAMRQKLLELHVTHVLMESTGVYWMPIYDVLDGFVEVIVANAQHVMNVPGRKTDESDAEWLAKLLRFGLVKPSFVPPRQIRELRHLTRYRRALVQARASEQNRIEKHLQITGVKLSSVTSKVFGVSGTDMLHHIADGKTDPTDLAALARGRLRKKIEPLREAFASPISEQTQQLIGIQLDQIKRLTTTIEEVEAKIRAKAEPHRAVIERLDQIPGVNQLAAIDIIAEIGTDMSPWKTHRQIAAMAGVCPGNYISAGKRLKNRSRQGNPYLKSILVQVATSAVNTNGSFFQARYKQLKHRRGHKRAILAIAHSMLIAIYYMLSRDQDYREFHPQPAAVVNPISKANALVRQLQSLGYSVALENHHA
jgi:transposase